MVNTPSSSATAVSVFAPARRDWMIAGAALAVGLGAFGYIFRTEIAIAIHVWNNSDAYNHCFLVLPVAAYLAWERREAIATTVPRPAPWVALLAVPVAAAWFAADRLGIMEGRQLTAMTLLQVMVLAVVGWAAWRQLATPLLYLYFLVPFGDFVVGPLRILATHFATFGLNLAGVPTYSDGVIIQIPEGTFLIHQACSGLRFLIASAAFGVLYSCIMYTSPLRRLVFSLLAIALAIVGNCFRVLGTILIAHFIGNVQAVEADHVLWGWGFYVLIGAALILIGFRFRQEPPRPPAVMPPVAGRVAGPAAIALAATVFLAAMPSVAADYLDNSDAAGAARAAPIAMPTIAGCIGPTPIPAGTENNTAAGRGVSAGYRCAGFGFTLTVYRYWPRIGARPLFLAYKAAETPPHGGDLLETYNFQMEGIAAPIWQVTTETIDGGTRFAAVARSLWLDGRPAGGGIRSRLDQALNTVRRAPRAPVLAVVTHYSAVSPNEAHREVDAFLAKTGNWTRWVNGWLARPASG
jgi:exosortase A